MGNGFSIETSSKNLLLLAGGIGIAPLKFLAVRAIALDKNVTILIGARNIKGLFPDRLLPPSVKIIHTIEQGMPNKDYYNGTVLDVLPEHLAKADQIFACGPQPMYIALSEKIKSLSVNMPVQVSLEVRMGCGTGICYSCSIMTNQGIKRVCKDGPVFNIKDIIWQEVLI
jgi:dihydroorotate dehydrogenase electron transfer subunit